MLQKQNRIRKDREFSFIYRRSKKFANEDFVLYLYPKNYCFKVGFSISKKVGKANVRNKLKRRLSEIVRLQLDNIKDVEIILVVLKGANEKSYSELENSLNSLFKKCSVYK